MLPFPRSRGRRQREIAPRASGVVSGKDVGGGLRFLQRFQRHPGFHFYSPDSAEFLWNPLCRSITYRGHCGIGAAESRFQGGGLEGRGDFNIAQGGIGGNPPPDGDFAGNAKFMRIFTQISAVQSGPAIGPVWTNAPGQRWKGFYKRLY